jgi:hypothetical protein
MRKLVLLICVIAFVSCSNEKPKDTNSAIFVEDQLRDFINFNSDWTKDETTKEQITDKFKHKVINWSNEPDFLKNMPLQLKEIKDTLISEQATKVAIFKTYGDKSRSENSLLNYMQLQITGIVSDTQLKNLTVDKKYTISGTLHKQGKRADVQFIHVADFKGYDLGKYIFLITEFKSF